MIYAVPHVQYFNFYYFLAIFGMAVLATLSLLLCKKKGKKFTHGFVLALIWANFALHFLKQFLPYYSSRWPNSLIDSGVPNLCAFLVFFSPLLYMSKNKYLRDYFFYVGVVSGILVYFWPTTPAEFQADGATYVLECIRFYWCHLVILIAPMAMMVGGIHTLSIRRIWAVPLLFTAVLGIIVVHCAIAGPILHLPGFVDEWGGVHGFFSRYNSNESMQFGPQLKLDKTLGFIYPYYFPYVLSFPVEGGYMFVPALWLLPLLYVATYIVAPVLILIFDSRQAKMERAEYQQRRQMRRLARKNKC